MAAVWTDFRGKSPDSREKSPRKGGGCPGFVGELGRKAGG